MTLSKLNRIQKIGLAVLLGLLAVSLLYLYSNSSRPAAPFLSPTPTFPPAQQDNPLPPNIVISQKAYFLRMVSIPSKASSVFWLAPAPYYISGNTLLDMSNLTPVYKFKGSTPFLISHSPHVSVVSGNTIESFNPPTKKVFFTNSVPNSTYSPSLEKTASYSSSKTTVSDPDGKTLASFSTSASQPTFTWSSAEDLLLAYQNKSASLYVLGPPQKELSPVYTSEKILAAEFSPSGRLLALLFPTSLQLFSPPNSSPIQTYQLQGSTSQSAFVWAPNEQLFLIEKQTRPREVEFIYLLSSNSPIKTYLLDTFSVASGIDLKVKPTVSKNNDLLFISKNGIPWIISTTPEDPKMRFSEELSRQAP